MFIRVKSANPTDPQHEYDASERAVAAAPERYIVIDPEPVDRPRPATYVKRRASGGAVLPGSDIETVLHAGDQVVPATLVSPRRRK